MTHRPEDDPFIDCDLRRFARFPVRCRAQIRVGQRHYTGYVDNLSEGGAKLTTFTPIQDTGKVLLRMPDLPPLKGELRWYEGTAAGIAFCLGLSQNQLSEWARNRLSMKELPTTFSPDSCD